MRVRWGGGVLHCLNVNIKRSWLNIRDLCGSSALLACLQRACKVSVVVDLERSRFVVKKRLRFVDERLKTLPAHLCGPGCQ